MWAMDFSTLSALVQESIVLIAIVTGFLLFAMVKGRQSLINIIMGLYIGLLLSMVFPYTERLTSSTGSETAVSITIFVIAALAATLLFNRLMPTEFSERAFESFGKKLLFAAAGTVLVLAFSYQVLPLSEFIDPGPIKALFVGEDTLFWWLLLPLVVLFFL